jgi:hypothetical protein
MQAFDLTSESHARHLPCPACVPAGAVIQVSEGQCLRLKAHHPTSFSTTHTDRSKQSLDTNMDPEWTKESLDTNMDPTWTNESSDTNMDPEWTKESLDAEQDRVMAQVNCRPPSRSQAEKFS